MVVEVCTCGCKGRELNEHNLASLKKYEKDLEDELQKVRKKISVMNQRRR